MWVAVGQRNSSPNVQLAARPGEPHAIKLPIVGPGWVGCMACQQCNPRFGDLAGNYSTINFIQAAESADLVARTPGGRVRTDRAIEWPDVASLSAAHVSRYQRFFDADRAARASFGRRRFDCRSRRGRYP